MFNKKINYTDMTLTKFDIRKSLILNNIAVKYV